MFPPRVATEKRRGRQERFRCRYGGYIWIDVNEVHLDRQALHQLGRMLDCSSRVRREIGRHQNRLDAQPTLLLCNEFYSRPMVSGDRHSLLAQRLWVAEPGGG